MGNKRKIQMEHGKGQVKMRRLRKGVESVMLFFALAAAFCACRSEETGENRRTEFVKMEVPLESESLQCFAISEEGELFSARWDGTVVQIAADGSVKNTFSEVTAPDTLCSMGNNLYIYQSEQGELLCLNPETGKTTLVLEGLNMGTAMNLTVAGGKLYLLAAGDGMYHHFVYEIDIKRKQLTELPFRDVSAIYGASDGTLYFCRNDEEGTVIYSYEKSTEGEAPVYDFAETLGEDVLTAFVLEQDRLIYTTLLQNDMKMVLLQEGLQGGVKENVVISGGKNMQCVAGNIVYFSYGETIEAAGMGTVYIPELKLEEEEKMSEKEPEREKLTGKVTIATNMRAYIDIAAIKNISGISAKIEEPRDRSRYLAEIMSGNEEVDIYIFGMTEDIAQKMKNAGVYAPLNESDIITEYQKKCFDYIGEGMTAENGAIWALPFCASAQVVWYVPENFEEKLLSTAALQDWEEFFALSEKAKGFENYGGYVTGAGSLGMDLWKQYDNVYCNFSKGEANYHTELFRRYFDKMWSGWEVYSPEPQHPLLRTVSNDGEMEWEQTQFQKQSTLFCIEDLRKNFLGYRSEEGWRVTGIPRLSKDVTKGYVNCFCAIVNPVSPNKELAFAYLEAIAENPGVFTSIYTEFIFEDEAMYEGRYDLTQAQVRDIYNVMKEGTLSGPVFSEKYNLVDEYQKGRYTLDEVIDKIERDTDMWLNE